ncbi:GCN5-related N-acetyltransferase [Deinococcus proteolyticus MRP]|uniref:GCN5-related N-acetyltransferase n=1 Tax=Deinococcus proteolyticus (strain ATCC 35074 / DSM 20540 / JCM 6276 / NBRC 101906 / NCIMB 13154 / VKM Ac-1939 / CCM 2703 / MRP) TaxID=693977 RepID=F0RP75_DEIPM|nr:MULTISPECIES: GNAT family N-acetyltransferase [Deinococcus]ADY25390.1 GCN5-related N-acetyltransferase [Deinococcus proteolyticus MRP]MCY1701515.1 GNAT family N-acetyltransferase [Deinococcus sp. SL84]
MTLTVRRATSSDLPAILALLERAEMYTTSVTLAGDVTYLLGEVEGRPAAVLGLEYGEGAGLLRSFTVHPDDRGRGWSGRMLAEAYALLRARGCREVFLFSADEGAFWAHQGYQPVPPQELARRLPQAPQVQHALATGWLTGALAWHAPLPQ